VHTAPRGKRKPLKWCNGRHHAEGEEILTKGVSCQGPVARRERKRGKEKGGRRKGKGVER